LGRHSAPQSSAARSAASLIASAKAAQAASATVPPNPFTVVDLEPSAAARRPLWRRSPALPALALVLSIWGADRVYKVTTEASAASASNQPALVHVDTSALAVGGQTEASIKGDTRTSRSKRSAGTPSDTEPLPARQSLPKIDPDKTVLGVWVRPSAGGMSSCFCMRWGVMHDGIDLAGPEGSPIVAVGDGVVLEAGPEAGFGHWIAIQHANGDVSIYGHMYSVLVSKGEHVVAGQHIADIGSDGYSTGPHLHFGVMPGHMGAPYIDPVPWLRARGVLVGPYDPNA